MIRFRQHGVFALLGASPVGAQAPNSAWVYPSATGNLLSQLDERGQRIADFSHCGYRGGTEPLPNVDALIPQDRWVYVSPDGTADDTARFQAAVDSVKVLTPDANDWRGVVCLNAGEYQLATTLTINASAVEITYTRSKTALSGGVNFTVEWSDTLAPFSWFPAGVTQSILTDIGTLQSVKAAVPAGPTLPMRVARLKVISP